MHITHVARSAINFKEEYIAYRDKAKYFLNFQKSLKKQGRYMMDADINLDHIFILPLEKILCTTRWEIKSML